MNELKKYYELIGEIWQYLKRNYPPDTDNPDYWANLIWEGDRIYLVHDKMEFAKEMVLAVVQELERKSRQ